MSVQNNTTRLVPAITVPEGAGVTVQRTIGSPALRNYDPFMLLDYFSSDNPNDYIAGFPDHPHRGFSTFTYMLDGLIEHQDSMGNTGRLEPGSAQLMKAGSGVIHSEMPQQKNGLLRGFQLWINLPAAHKMDMPEYQEYAADAFPIVERGHYRVKVLIGHHEDTASPIIDDITLANYLDVELSPGKTFEYDPPTGHNSLLFVFEGSGNLSERPVANSTLVTLGSQDLPLQFSANHEGARFLVVTGKPINESIVQYGPFVMNSREEINQALQDFQTNNFVRDRAWVNRN